MRRCPQCGSREARRSHRRDHERWASALLVYPFRCRACGRRFWAFLPPGLPNRDLSSFAFIVLAVIAVAIAMLFMARLPYAADVEETRRRQTPSVETPASGLPDPAPVAEVDSEPPPAASPPASRPPASVPDTFAAAGPPSGGAARAFGGVEMLAVEADRVQLKLLTGSPPPPYSYFFLANPPRYVIDVEGRWTVPPDSSEFLNQPLVTSVRIGRHDEMVRVVVDLGPERGSAADLEEAADGLIVTFRKR